MSLKKSTSSKRSRLGLLADRVMAVLILVNVGLVVFDLTYVKARPVYLRSQIYLNRSRVTRQEDYVKTVETLEQELKQGGIAKSGNITTGVAAKKHANIVRRQFDSCQLSVVSIIPATHWISSRRSKNTQSRVPSVL